MRFQKVLLISPYYGGSYSAVLPAGLGYIAESLERHGIEYNVLDLQFGYDEKKIHAFIMQFRPDLVGFSVITYKYVNVYRLARLIKEWLPETQIVLGGPFISTFRNKALEDCPDIDYGVILEGDETIIELCEGKDPASIKGLIYRDNGEIIYTGDRPFLTDLDAVPFPRYSRFQLDKYPMKTIAIVSSRGCPYKCIYCPVNLSIGYRFRARSSESVVDELEYWYRRGYRRLGYADDNFTFLRKRVHAICDEVETRGLVGLELLLGNGIRADRVDRELLARMKKIGFRHISFGVESASNRILKSLQKSETIEQIEQAIDIACQLGIGVKLHFIVGSPGETLSDVQDSITLALKYPVEEASFNNLMPYPGTELFDWLSANGYLLYPPEEYLNRFSPSSATPVFFTPEFSVEDRKRALLMTGAVRDRILKRSYTAVLSKLGPFAGLAASIAIAGPFKNNLLLHPRFRQWAKRVADFLA